MKIDPTIQPSGNIQPELAKNSRQSGVSSPGAPDSSASTVNSQDTVSISSAHGDVQTLKSSLVNVPEVRTGRVAALQQQVHAGQYQPDSGKLADSIIAEQASRARTGT
jgi:flagellar biosynthesis anti-sigma factor FlgM